MIFKVIAILVSSQLAQLSFNFKWFFSKLLFRGGRHDFQKCPKFEPID